MDFQSESTLLRRIFLLGVGALKKLEPSMGFKNINVFDKYRFLRIVNRVGSGFLK